MNKKTYCTPAINVAEGALQSTLLAGSGPKDIQTQSFTTRDEGILYNINRTGSSVWETKENSEEDEDFNF